jgi:glycosyltransferase involved in cell wall biosynthesis
MKLLYDYEIFTRQRYGGISRYFYEVITRLNELKEAEIELFLGINNSGYGFEKTLGKKFVKGTRFKGADSFHLLLNVLNKYWFEKFTRGREFDIFHKTYYSNAGLNCGAPVISTVHDMTHELYPEYFAKADNTSELKRKVAESSEAIICVSESTKQDLKSCFNISDEKIRVIYHGLSLEEQPGPKRIVSEPYILYVGQRWGYKNFKVLANAIESSDLLRNKFKLVCFGGGKLSLSEKIYIKENRLTGSIIFLSGSDEMLANLYKFAELLVYTSIYEGFGFPPLEAMSLGCPVLTSTAGSVIEVAAGAAMYFDPLEKDDLESKIIKVIEDTELRNNMISKGRARAGGFSWKRSAEKHIELYKEISNSK